MEQRNPLLVDVILEEVFSMLKHRDLQNCRQVCKKWLDRSEAAFRQSARLRFPQNLQWKPRWIKMSTISTVFPNLIKNGARFSAIKLEGPIQEEFLQDLFHSQLGRHINDISFENVRIYDNTSDISSKIAKLKFRNPLTRIRLEEDDRLKIEDDQQPVQLPFASINSKDNSKIFIKNGLVLLDSILLPKRLHLENIRYYDSKNDESYPSNVSLKEYIDFSECQFLFLMNDATKTDQDLMVEMIGTDINIERVILDGVTWSNRDLSTWKIGYLNLRNISLFVVPTKELLLTSLEITNWDRMDLSALPSSIQTLTIDGSCNLDTIRNWKRKLFVSTEVSLHNLKTLHFTFSIKCRPKLRLFENCLNLETLFLEGEFPYIYKISYIPTSTKKIYLRSIKVLPNCVSDFTDLNVYRLID